MLRQIWEAGDEGLVVRGSHGVENGSAVRLAQGVRT